jgi:hypothetical protein
VVDGARVAPSDRVQFSKILRDGSYEALVGRIRSKLD